MHTMLSEHISFIVERIPDILNFDNERNQILTLCKKLSHDERKGFLEWHSNYLKREFLEMSSDDKMREIREFYSDDKIKEVLKWYCFDPLVEMKKLYSDDEIEEFREMYWFYTSESSESDDDEIPEILKLYFKYKRERAEKLSGSKEFLNLYLPRDKIEYMELKKMYRELSDDDKLEFLHKYNSSWRRKLLIYLEIRHNHPVETFFNILTLLMEGKEVIVLSNDVKKGIVELQKGLSLIYNCVRVVEAKYDDSQVLSEHDKQLFNILSHLAHSSDDLLDRVMSNDATAREIDTRLQTIYFFCSNNLSSIQFNLNVNVRGNINSDGIQNIANSNITINHSNPSPNNNYSRPKTYGHVPNPDLIGFNHEIRILLNHLILPHYETRVLGIVGPGGSGKTTLAKHIYHHPEINSHFASKVWVCISQSWDKTTILNSILRQAAQNPMASEMGYDQLVECLSQLLCSKSYLVIVDDIWSVDAWYDISPALPARSRSKVVVTTRNKFLPQHIDPGVLIVEPKQLNDEESYELFKKRALLDENIHHELKSLGVEMLKKCKGLPLAVVALAGVLGIDKSLSSWERISKRVTDQMLNMANDSTQGVVKEILAMSYYELPKNLKPCALYLGVFPEDHVIEAPQLIRMWVAECFMDEEDKAEEHLEQLAQRCIVEVTETNNKGQVFEFRIHDLIREMLINIEKERGMVQNQELRVALSETLYGNGKQAVWPWEGERYESWKQTVHSYKEEVERYLCRNPHARSLMSLSFPDYLKLEPLFIKLKLLRVLIIYVMPNGWLPEEIGNLIHLRYLQLGGHTYHLPRSIGNLENLLTLNFEDLEIPDDVKTINLGKLKELRHLYMPVSWNCYMEGVMGIEKLKKLKTLRNFHVKWMSSVPKWSDALQELSVHNITEEKQVKVVFTTPSITANKLHTLELCWDELSDYKMSDMSMMSKCKSITKLVLDGKIKKGTRLMFPPNLIHLEMISTEVKEKKVMNIINDSCPLLKFLFLLHRAYTGTELICYENSFSQLERLELVDLSKLERWIIERGAMPRLNHLKIEECPTLEVNDEARELISKLAPSFIPKLTLPRRSSKRKTLDLFPDLLS